MPKKKKAGNYPRNNRIYTNPDNGESGDTIYWSKKIGIRQETFWRRAKDWGEDNPKTYGEPICRGEQHKCNKFSSDIVYQSTLVINKELADKIELAKERGVFKMMTSLISDAINSFEMREEHNELVKIPIGISPKDKSVKGTRANLKLNNEQVDKVDRLMDYRIVWMEYNGSERNTCRGEAIELILKEYLSKKEEEHNVS